MRARLKGTGGVLVRLNKQPLPAAARINAGPLKTKLEELATSMVGAHLGIMGPKTLTLIDPL